MKDFRSLYGSRIQSGGFILGYFPLPKGNVIQRVEGQYDEKVIRCMELFNDKDEHVVGWLIITESRIIFRLEQDVNLFKEETKIIWVIDNVPILHIKPEIVDENAVRISDNKEVLFSKNNYSAERLVKEIVDTINEIKISKERRQSLKKKRIPKLPRIRLSKELLHNQWIITIIGGIIVVIIGAIALSYFGYG